MTTPNTSIASLGLSDINTELAYTANTARSFNDGVFRNLTGVQIRTLPQAPISLSDLSNKTAFGGIMSTNSATISSFGSLSQEIVLTANTDMYNPDVAWSANVISGAAGTLVQNGKVASYKVSGAKQQNVSSNVQITAVLSFDGHVIGTASKYISFSINSLDPNLTVTGNTSANLAAFEPTTAQTTVTATSDAAGSVIQFTVTPNDGGVRVSGNSVIFTAVAATAGIDNNRSYSMLTELLFNGEVIASSLQDINVHAEYQIPDFVFTVPNTSNNNFANTGTVRSSMTLSASHDIAGANMAWSAVKVSGDDAVLTVAADLGSANLHVNVASGVFQTKKSVYDVLATLQYSNGQIITSKTQRLTLRTGAYGLSFVAAANTSANGYTAQTGISTATASYQAGQFSWNIARISGDVLTVANTIVAGSATASLNINRSSTGSNTATYRINPVLMFDGVVMANVAAPQTQMYCQVAPYSFSTNGALANTVLDASPVIASITTTASHDVANGSVIWTKSSSPSSLSANGLTSNVAFSCTSIGTDNFVLTASLYDEQSRFIESINRSIVLRAFDPAITWIGANSVSSIGYNNQNVVADVVANARSGANTFNVTAAKLQGATLTVTTLTGNTTSDKVQLTATQNAPGTSEGLYRVTANATWFGVSNTSTYDVSVSATKIDDEYTLVGSNGAQNSFNFPVVVDATAVASHVVPDGVITWSHVVNSGAIMTVQTANATHYVLRNTQSAVGNTTGVATVTGVLRDAAGNFVEQKTVVLSVAATRNNPTLVLSGPATNSVSNTFNATASIILTPSVVAGLTGHTYQFSWIPVSGSATVTANSSAVLLTNTFDGAGSVSGTYDVTCNVVLSGQTIATTTRRVTVEAVCPMPTINFTSANDTERDFNFPVSSTATAVASSTPAGAAISWNWTKVSGSTMSISTDLAGSRINVGADQSNIGVLAGTYDVTATYRTPNGTLLTTRTARITATSERYDPKLTWTFNSGTGANSVSGFANTLTSAVSLHASVNPALTGHTYRITRSFVSGNFNQAALTTSNAAGTATSTLVNDLDVDGNNQKTAVYDIFIDVMLNSQAITGKLVQRVTHTITPGVVSDVGDIELSSSVWSGTASASFTFNPDGTVDLSGIGPGSTRYWMTPSNTTEAAKYQISYNDGSTWTDLNVSSGQSVSATATPPQHSARSKTGIYKIRVKASGVVIGSGSYDLEVTVGQQL